VIEENFVDADIDDVFNGYGDCLWQEDDPDFPNEEKGCPTFKDDGTIKEKK